MRTAPPAACVALGTLLLAALTGCPFDPVQDEIVVVPPSKFLPRISAENLLENLKAAYEEREIAEYESLLAASFTFVFVVEIGPGQLPDSWGRGPEIEAHRNIFDAAYVQSLSLEFDYTEPRFDEEHFNGVDSLWISEITNFDMTLLGCPPSQPVQIPELYEVEDSQMTVRFQCNEWSDAKGHPIWSIVEIEELAEDLP